MRKRVGHNRDKGNCNFNDRISQLPDDILVFILSHMTPKGAALTSILSRRWRYLWTFTTRLVFNADETINKIANDRTLFSVEKTKYVDWVNLVVKQHRGQTINLFKICFEMDRSSKNAIDDLVKFAIAKRVQKLVLDLTRTDGSCHNTAGNYVFPYEFLSLTKWSSLKHLHPNFPSISPCTFLGCQFLRSLILKSVNVGEEALEYVFTNCPLLRVLIIRGSGDLVSIRFIGPSLMLKCIEISFCRGLETIEIRDTNILSFKYFGVAINLIIKNVPMLREISIGEGCFGLENNVFGKLSCCLSQLTILHLHFFEPEKNMKHLAFPEFPKVKQLILNIGARGDDSLLEFTSLAKACPFLQRFVLKLVCISPLKRRKKIRHAAKYPHRHLKLVEIEGYFGRISDDEIAVYFMENAVPLKKIVIDPCRQRLRRPQTGMDYNKMAKAARKHAKRYLEGIKPPGVQLVIL